jgi:hypothetical protein
MDELGSANGRRPNRAPLSDRRRTRTALVPMRGSDPNGALPIKRFLREVNWPYDWK